MKDQDFKIKLGAVQETLLLPLWARAKDMETKNPIASDRFAQSIISRIDYDFSKFEGGQVAAHRIVWPIRACNFDRIAGAFLAQNRSALVINLGAGLDTAFQRVDDGKVEWINIELPDVAALRMKLIPDSERETTIPKSIFDFTWIDDIGERSQGRSILFMAAGILYYFEPREVEAFFRKLAGAFPSAHIIFDAVSRFAAWGTNRKIMKASGMDSSACLKWNLKRASRLRRWVDSIKVIEEYPLLSRMPHRSGLRRKTVWGIRIAGLFRFYNMVHVQL